MFYLVNIKFKMMIMKINIWIKTNRYYLNQVVENKLKYFK